jgi:DNA polymerase I
MSDRLLYGKSNINGIVSMEVDNDKAELFIQNENGGVSSIHVDNRFWILSNKNIDGSFKKLDGSLHYQWGRLYKDRKEYEKARSDFKRKEHDIFSIWNDAEALMVKDGYSYFRGLKQKDISLLSFDLETTGLDGKAPDAKIVLISTTYRDVNGSINKLFSHDEYETEGHMLEAFCSYVLGKDPTLLVGHNILGFDFPYLRDRADANDMVLILGRNDSEIEFARYESKYRLDSTRDLLYKNVSVYGREIVDTFLLAHSFDVSKKYESYALKPLIKQLGFEKEGRQYYDAGSIRLHYNDPEEMKKIKQYAIDDAEDAVKIWDYMGPLFFNMGPMIPKRFSQILLTASGSKINSMMVRSYLQDKHSLPKATPVEKFKGATSFAVPGIYNNCFKIDIASLYPNIILSFGLYDKEKDPKQHLLTLVKIFKENRLKLKKLAAETSDDTYKQMDTTTKGILNSFYGFLSAQGLLFNSPSIAAFITAKGREILDITINYFSGKRTSDFVKEEVEEEIEE